MSTAPTTFLEKVNFLIEKQAYRGAGEQLLLTRTRDAFEKNPDHVPPYNTKVLIDACMDAYTRRLAKRRVG